MAEKTRQKTAVETAQGFLEDIDDQIKAIEDNLVQVERQIADELAALGEEVLGGAAPAKAAKKIETAKAERVGLEAALEAARKRQVEAEANLEVMLQNAAQETARQTQEAIAEKSVEFLAAVFEAEKLLAELRDLGKTGLALNQEYSIPFGSHTPAARAGHLLELIDDRVVFSFEQHTPETLEAAGLPDRPGRWQELGIRR